MRLQANLGARLHDASSVTRRGYRLLAVAKGLSVERFPRLVAAINLKTARALELDVPLHLQQLADELIE